MPREPIGTILLVEDDEALAEGLRYTLEKENYDTLSAASAAEAERLFNGNGPDLILLDVGLPDGSGFDLCRKIRLSSDIPIIFLTACDEEVNIVMGLDLGGDDYITKPFRINELISRINAVRRRKSPGTDNRNIIKSDGFILNRDSYRFLKNGEDLQLTSTEFRLVSILFANRGRIISRDMLITKLWDSEEHFIDSNTLSVYIRRLREKIEIDPAEPKIIETIRGIGYRWN